MLCCRSANCEWCHRQHAPIDWSEDVAAQRNTLLKLTASWFFVSLQTMRFHFNIEVASTNGKVKIMEWVSCSELRKRLRRSYPTYILHTGLNPWLQIWYSSKFIEAKSWDVLRKMEGADDQQLLSWMDGIRSTVGLCPDVGVRKALHESGEIIVQGHSGSPETMLRLLRWGGYLHILVLSYVFSVCHGCVDRPLRHRSAIPGCIWGLPAGGGRGLQGWGSQWISVDLSGSQWISVDLSGSQRTGMKWIFHDPVRSSLTSMTCTGLGEVVPTLCPFVVEKTMECAEFIRIWRHLFWVGVQLPGEYVRKPPYVLKGQRNLWRAFPAKAVARLHVVQLSGDSQDKTEASSGTLQVEGWMDHDGSVVIRLIYSAMIRVF